VVYSRVESSLTQTEGSTLFTIKELRKWVHFLRKKDQEWKWPFLEQKQVVAPYYTPKNTSDTTLIFESRFESGNLLLAVKITNNEYKLLLQNDSLTNKTAQCFLSLTI